MYRIIIALILFFISSPSWAALWYVRDGGGNKTQCTGKTNAVYPGSGSGQNCAYSNPMFALGAGCGNYGFATCDVAPVISSGDTVFIDGDSDITPGSQAQYPIGYDSTGAVTPTNSTNCSAGGSLNCTMANPPSGSGPSGLTQIIGTGTHKPQLWGREKINQVLEADANYVLVNNIEVTDHSACIDNGFPGSGTVDGFPVSCQSSTAPFGPWAKEGVFYGGTGSTLENTWIHGIANDGTNSDNISGFTSFNNVISGNGFNGDGPGALYNSSGQTVTIDNSTWQNDIIVYNGCGEHYPVHSSNPYDTANYHNCHDAGASGQGDGLGSQANESICTGNISFINDDVSFNTQDGFDFLHCEGDGNVYAYRIRAEGNEGQQIKFNNANVYVENSLIIGDCYYFAGQPFTYTETGTAEYCRAGGEAINMVFNGGTYSIENSTALATGPGIQDAGASSPCSGTLNWYNDNVIGGWNTPAYGNNALATWIDHECTSGSVTFNEDYNHVWNTSNQAQCGSSPGTHDKCSDTSAAVTGNLLSALGPSTYYSNNDLGHILYPSSGGQLVGTANNALSLTGTPNDFNNFSRGSSWSQGGFNVNSCVAPQGTCFESTECCTGTCTSNVCPGSCTSTGGSCSVGSTCCTGLCSGSLCVSCLSNGNSCSSNSNCCSGACSGSMCITAPLSGSISSGLFGQSNVYGKSNY